jgi:hypothetical protein
MNKPTTLDEIYAQRDWWWNRLDRAEKRRLTAQRTVDRCYKHIGVTTTVQHVAQLLQPHFPQYKLYVLGPFGLGSRVSIHANKPTVTGAASTVASLDFRPDNNGRLRLVDYSRQTREYAPNSVGELNGLNFPEVDLPETIEELAALLQAKINENKEN